MSGGVENEENEKISTFRRAARTRRIDELVGRLTQTSPFAENEFRRLMGTRVQATNPLNGHPHDN